MPTWLAIVLLGAGVADLVRSSVGRRGRVAAHVAAPVTVALAAVLTDVDGWADVLALAVGAAGLDVCAEPVLTSPTEKAASRDAGPHCVLSTVGANE